MKIPRYYIIAVMILPLHMLNYSLRSVSRPSSPTPPSVSVFVSSSSRTERRSPLSSPTTVASTLSKKTTKSLSQALVERVTPSVIFPESGSRSSR